MDSLGRWITYTENDGSAEHPFHMPYVHFDSLVDAFLHEFCQFSEVHPECKLTDYQEILTRKGLDWGAEMQSTDVNALDDQSVLALIMCTIRAERFDEGILIYFFENVNILKWLQRLQGIVCKQQKDLQAHVAHQ